MPIPSARSAAVPILGVAILVAASGCTTHAPEIKPEPPAAPVAPAPVAPAPVAAQPARPPAFATAYFSYDRAELSDAARAALQHDVDALLAHPELKINVEGHCDERGTEQYNIDLGWKRAYAARDFLKRLGIAEERLFPISYGRSRPAVVGTDESAWSRNRRVEISVRT